MTLKKSKKAVIIASGVILCTVTSLVMGLKLWRSPQETPTPPLDISYCHREVFEGKSYIVCRANPANDDIRLFLHNEQGAAYKRFLPLNAELKQKGEKLAFAMNAGMYHANYDAVGLYVENGVEKHGVSTKAGPGNFHMMPNGIFYLHEGQAAILDTQAYLAANIKPQFATQSGPMLVIDNELHPRFIPGSPFLEYRNGVGVTESGEVIFIISETKVNFEEMARFFRDQLATPNALFLDGSISSLYAPQLGRADWWYPMGPIIGVVIQEEVITTP